MATLTGPETKGDLVMTAATEFTLQNLLHGDRVSLILRHENLGMAIITG